MNPPEDAVPLLDALLSEVTAKRDAALIHLAFAVVDETIDGIGAASEAQRSVSKRLDELLGELHIERRKEAFQTVAKGSADLLNLSGKSRAGKAFSPLLRLAKNKSVEEVREMVVYLAQGIVATARELPPMPGLDVSTLTYPRVLRVLDGLLGVPSKGAHEQFLFAALLHAVHEEAGGSRVATKTLTAADAAAGTAGDVQVWRGSHLDEAYEVTSNAWHTKLDQAAAIALSYDLPRVHVVAPGPAPTADELRKALSSAALPSAMTAENFDVSVLDVREECRSLLHRLSRQGRRLALIKLREHLVERQPDDALVVDYVALLHTAGLTTGVPGS